MKPTETNINGPLEYILRQYEPIRKARGISWSLHCIPFWSGGEGQVGLKLLCYRNVGSKGMQIAGVGLRVVEAFIIGLTSETGIEAVGMVGGVGNAPFDESAKWLGKADVMHGVAGGPNPSTVGNMQVAGAKESGDPTTIYHAIKAGGEVLMEAIVRVEPITGGTRIVIHPAMDAAHSDMLQSKVTDLHAMSHARTYWVYSNGHVYENGTPIGSWR
ncbi:MAG: hypothetical protein AAGF11_34810 [Myxococcota bacterium]